MEFLNAADIALFRFINGALRNGLTDVLMPVLTDLLTFKPTLVVVAAILLAMIVKGNRQVRLAALLVIPTIILSDQLNSAVLKHILERLRPCHTLADVHLLVGCGGGYSFPSSHAVNNFAVAVVLAWFIPRGQWWFLGFAALVALSRVFVGVHYPSDVLGGSVIGVLIGAFVITVFERVESLWWSSRSSRVRTS